MDTGAIPALSMELSLAKVQQSAHFSILKKAMQTQIDSVEGLYKEIPDNFLEISKNMPAAIPNSDHLIDTYA